LQSSLLSSNLLSRNSPDQHGSEPSPSDDSLDSDTTSSSGVGTSSPESTKTDGPCIGQTIRVLRGILKNEYDLYLGISEPPEDMVDAVSSCLRRLSFSVDRERSLGCVVQLKSFLGDSLVKETADAVAFPSAKARHGGYHDKRRKRGGLNNDNDNEDDIHDEDPDEEGGGACVDPNTSGTKKAKTEQLACPFRKLDPLRHNCREWEFCSKSPFRNMSELKYTSMLQTSTQHLLTTWFTENTSSGSTSHPNLPSGASDATSPFPGKLTWTHTSGRRTDRDARLLHRQVSHRTERTATASQKGSGAE